MTRKEGGKHSFNIVLPPQIFGTIAEHLECKDPVYFHCMPSGLHYILGIVELFHDNMKIKFPEETAEWVKKSTAKESDNPKQKFKGPDCIKLLECLYVFENKNGDPIRLDIVPYVNCLKSFNKVRKTQFIKSTDIDLDLARRAREEFKADCKIVIEDFDVHAINKIHCVVIHVGQWVEHFKIGLGFVLEHTGEAIHHSFDKHCLNTALIADYKHPGYLGDLKKKTAAYVSGNCRRVPGKRLW